MQYMTVKHYTVLLLQACILSCAGQGFSPHGLLANSGHDLLVMHCHVLSPHSNIHLE